MSATTLVDPGALGDFLKFLEIISIVGTGLYVVFKVGRAVERFELIGLQQAKEIGDLKSTIQKVADAQVSFMSEKVRLDSLGTSLAEMRKELNLLREGRGFIQPRVDGEYPRGVTGSF